MLSDKYKYSLVFTINKKESNETIKKWREIKHKCEYGDNENLVIEWLKRCDKESIKSLPYLKRSEGGIGGDDESNRQIRFSMSFNPNNIEFNTIYYTETEKWSQNDLEDLAHGFVKYVNEYIQKECVSGKIKRKKIPVSKSRKY